MPCIINVYIGNIQIIQLYNYITMYNYYIIQLLLYLNYTNMQLD